MKQILILMMIGMIGLVSAGIVWEEQEVCVDQPIRVEIKNHESCESEWDTFEVCGNVMVETCDVEGNCTEEEEYQCWDELCQISNEWNGEYKEQCSIQNVSVDSPPSMDGGNVTIKADTVIAKEYLYGSEGFNADNISTPTLLEALRKIEVQADGEINKTSLPNKAVKEVDGELYEKSGVMRSFLTVIQQRMEIIISNILDRLGANEDRLDTIEGDLCSQGINKYC